MLFFDWGYLGVPVFFVLSGFVIAHSLFSREFSWAGFKTFVMRRFLRIAPAYWASIAITMILDITSGVVRGEALALPSTFSLGAHLFFLQDLLHQAEISPVYWTLAIEMQFYALFYGLLWLNQRWQVRATAESRLEQLPAASLQIPQSQSPQSYGAFLLLAGAIALPSLAFAPQIFGWARLILPYWYCFLLGILTHWSLSRRSHYGWLLGLLATCGFLAAPNPGLFSVYLASCGLTVGLIGLAALGWLTRSCGWLTSKLGNLSYSVYLIHGAVFGPFFFLRQRLLGSAGAGLPGSGVGLNVWLDLLSLGGAIALTCAAAALLHHGVEQPSLKWNQRLRAQRR